MSTKLEGRRFVKRGLMSLVTRSPGRPVSGVRSAGPFRGRPPRQWIPVGEGHVLDATNEGAISLQPAKVQGLKLFGEAPSSMEGRHQLFRGLVNNRGPKVAEAEAGEAQQHPSVSLTHVALTGS